MIETSNQLALNVVHEGDCLELMRHIPNQSVHMILCDLPYGTTANKWDSVIPFGPLWEHYERIITDTGVIALFGSEPFSTALRQSNIKQYKYDWVWIKNKGLGFQHARNMPLKRHELISIFSKAPMGHVSLLGDKRMTYNPQGVIETGETGVITANKHGNNLGARPNQVGRTYKKATNFPSSVLLFDSEPKPQHPTQKPVSLCEYLIKTYTNEGGTVLDNCIGSGTTAVAAINTGRNFIGIEKEPEYAEIAKQRVAAAYEAKIRRKTEETQ